MKNIKYFFQFLIIISLFTFFKFLGLKLSSKLSGYIMYVFGPLFRSSRIAGNNIKKALPQSTTDERKIILKRMWHNYGKIFSEYMFLRKFRNSSDFSKNIFNKKLQDPGKNKKKQ